MGDIHLLLDTRGIQEYIFRAPKLKTVIGASAIIKHLNDVVIKEAVENITGSKENITYSGGGNAEIRCSSQDEAEKIADYVQEYCSQKGIILVSGYGSDYDSARKVLNAKKRVIPSGVRKSLTPFDKPCNLCLSEPGFELLKEDDASRYICRTCSAKISFPYVKEIWYKDFGEISDRFVSDFEKSGIESSRMAVVAMDGNRIGSLFAKSENKPEFSRKLDKITRGAVTETFSEYFRNQKSGTIFFRPLLLGGDDFIAIIDPDKVVDLVIDVCHEFQSKSHAEPEIFSNTELTISAGIAFVHTKYPLWRAITLAEDLLENAKKACPTGNISMIDFEVITESGIQNIGNIVNNHRRFTEKGNRFTLSDRPYEVSDLKSLINDARDLKELLARNQIRSFTDILTTGLLDSNYLFSRLLLKHDNKDGNLKKLLLRGSDVWDKNLETDDYHNNVLDLVVLSEMLKKTDGGNAHAES